MERGDIPESGNWLYQRFIENKTRNARVSLRAFARRIGVQPSAVSEIFSGKRVMTEKMARNIARKLNLNPIQQGTLLRSVGLSRIRRIMPEDGALNELSDSLYQKVDLDSFKMICHWYNYAILCLAELEQNRANVDWIARRFKLPKREVRSSLRTLARLGLISRNGMRLSPTNKKLTIETEGYDSALRTFTTEILEKSKRALEEVPAEDRELCTVVMAIDPKQIPKARAIVKRFRREMTDLLESGKKSRVYALSLQLFPLDTKLMKEE